MDTGLGIRLQIFVAILTGILVIVTTTAVVIGMGREQSNADGLDGSSDPFPTFAFPTPIPSPTSAVTSSPTPEASLSKKPSGKPSPTPPANKLMLSCLPTEITVVNPATCTVNVEIAATSNLIVTLDASAGFVKIPGTVTILAGGYFSDPFSIEGVSPGGPTIVTAKVGGLQAQVSITVS